MYNKINVQRHLEERECPNCGKIMCSILEVNLVIGTKGNYEFSPSLDRIDNTKGYIKGNVQVISKKANSMKNSASIEELKKFCANVLRYSLNSTEK